MSEQANRRVGGGQTMVTDVVRESVLGEKDDSPKTDFEHSLHHSTKCKSTLTRAA